MQANQSWIAGQAFGDNTEGLVTVTYKSHRDALEFTQRVLNDPQGVGLLQGPRGSGKSSIARRLVETMPGDLAVALVDGARVKSRELLSRILSGYGYETGLESNDELLKMMSVFAIQQTRSVQAPVLVVDNVDRMYPSALSTLDALAKLKIRDRYALRIIVTGCEALGSLIASSGMASLQSRSLGSFIIHPLSLKEALIYLHTRLTKSGVNNAETVFPVDVCDRLYQLSGGWPGELNRQAALAIGRASTFPLTIADTGEWTEVVKSDKVSAAIPTLGVDDFVAPLPPHLTITRHGEHLGDFTINQKKALIGRSDFADIVVEDRFVSKMHAVMLLYADALVLVDLNSANGTTVNSVKVSSTILKDDDIIVLGNHRLKVQNAPAISADMQKLLESADTVKMKSLVDKRRALARRLALAASKDKQQG